MGEKDLSEKILEDYNDVFADIVNTLIFRGKEVVKPSALGNSLVHSQYKADDKKLHELERDVTKYWKDYEVELAIVGIENQTKVDRTMPFRVIGYDGAEYRKQLLRKKQKIVPVVTIVLYFGMERWRAPKSIYEILDIPEGMEEFVNDYKIHVFEMAWLTDEQIAGFKSDFGVIAKFFVNKRKDPERAMEDQTVIKHVDEVLKLLSVMSGDQRYEKILKSSDKKKGVFRMCDVAERLEKKGIAKGRMEGRMEGRVEGQNLLVTVVQRLRAGETPEQIAASGVDQNTIDLALTIK